jgi:hypothetical protein
MSCAGCAETAALRLAALALEEPAFEAGIPTEALSPYKTIAYVAGVTIMDQVWYLAITSVAATTGVILPAANAATTSAMVYSYEFVWAFCCEAPPGPGGVMSVSVTKAIIYKGISMVEVGALTLAFGNNVASAVAVTGAVALSRTAVYVANDHTWNRIDARALTAPVETSWFPWREGARAGLEWCVRIDCDELLDGDTLDPLPSGKRARAAPERNKKP